MENKGFLRQGQKVDAIFCPTGNDGEQSGGAVGYDGITDIKIGRCAGPMGWYDVAIIQRGIQPEEIVPVHMAEYIRLAKY